MTALDDDDGDNTDHSCCLVLARYGIDGIVNLSIVERNLEFQNTERPIVVLVISQKLFSKSYFLNGYKDNLLS